MRKIYIFTAVIALFAAFAFVGPSAVFAQYGAYPTYGSTGAYGTVYGGSGYGYAMPYAQPGYGMGYSTPAYAAPYGTCLNLTANLYKGLWDASTGGQVSMLQSFLIARGYLSLAAPTGYYGAITASAVVRYQTTNGLPTDGTVGVQTRASINALSCGATSGRYNGGYNNYYGAPVISSLSTNSGLVGSSVTVYGSSFDYSNNTVNFDGTSMTGIPSYNGTSLTFTVPQVYAQNYAPYNYSNNSYGSYPIYVVNSRGTSNSLTFAITSGGSNCYNNNNYNNNNNSNYYQNGNCGNNGQVVISNIDGSSTLRANQEGTWGVDLENLNYSYVNVSVRWGDEGVYNNYNYSSGDTLRSSTSRDTQTLTFRHTYQNNGYYTVVFTATDNNGGQTVESTTVNVTGGNSNNYGNYGQVNLNSVSPTSGHTDRDVVLYGSGFTPTGNTVHFGNGGSMNINSIDGTRIYFTIPNYISPCNVSLGTFCPLYAQQVTNGTYPIYVTNYLGQSDSVNFRVTSY